MINISKNITYHEGTKSVTAVKNNIDNTPSKDQLADMKVLANKVFEPLRTGLGNKAINIAIFFRSPELNKAVGGAKGSQHCFDSETEILTDGGWKNLSSFNIKKHSVASLNTVEDKIEFVVGDEVIKFDYSGDVIRGCNKHIDYITVPEHRMYVSNSGENNNFSFEPAINGLNKRRIHKVAGLKESNEELPNVNVARFCAAIVAEGCVYTKKKSKNPIIRFNIKKEREIKELETLLSVLDIYYTKRYCKNREKQNQFGVFEYTINSTNAAPFVHIIGKNKKLPLWFLQYSSADLKEIILTYAKFDGSFDKRDNCTSISIFSTDEDNINILQAMSILSNMRCIKKKLENLETTYGGLGYIYHLYLSEHNTSRLNENTTSIEKFNGVMWSVNNKNTTLIARRNGKVFITGNCEGKAMDIDNDVYKKGPTNKQIFEYIKNNLEFDQLINEFPDEQGNPSWVHVSYNKGNNRKQVLVAKHSTDWKGSIKTIYEIYNG